MLEADLHLLSNVPLSDKNWFGTGGAARWYAQPTTAGQFAQALNFAKQQSLPLFVLGHGANLLVSDAGFDGLVIRPAVDYALFDAVHATVTAGAGLCIQKLIQICLDNGYIGLEEFSGIPGTVGGAVYINMHYFQFLLSQFLVRATVIERATGMMQVVDRDWFAFGYDYSTLFTQEYYLVDATFALTPADPSAVAFARGRRVEIIRHRTSRYPHERTCGSFFRNFFPEEVPFTVHGKKLLFIAYYLDQLGIKGQLRVRNAVVSYQHANMLVTLPGATSQDVVDLARSMQQKVYDAFGILPHAECQFVGFDGYPLMTVPTLQAQGASQAL